jgi:hypothetical protein
VTVLGGNFCLGLNPAVRAGQCDMDKDGIPDMCDSDIDGDGAQNPLGLISYMKPDCSYGPDNTQVVIPPGSIGTGNTNGGSPAGSGLMYG